MIHEPNASFPCLACGKILSEVSVGGVKIDACMDGCGGVWFDRYELGKVDNPEEAANDPVLQKLMDVPETFARDDRQKMCPRCATKLKQHSFRGQAEILIEECYGCGGVWLDGGELKAIRQSSGAQKSLAPQSQPQHRPSVRRPMTRLEKATKTNVELVSAIFRFFGG